MKMRLDVYLWLHDVQHAPQRARREILYKSLQSVCLKQSDDVMGS